MLLWLRDEMTDVYDHPLNDGIIYERIFFVSILMSFNEFLSFFMFPSFLFPSSACPSRYEISHVLNRKQ